MKNALHHLIPWRLLSLPAPGPQPDFYEYDKNGKRIVRKPRLPSSAIRLILKRLLILFFTLNISVLRAQNITYTPLHTASTFDRPLNVNLPVGTAPGQGEVSGSGAAIYTIPMAVPPGTNGVVPSLSVGYNSQSGNGIAGMGWSISGLSVISRTPQTIYHDGRVAQVAYNANDRFSLDGTRLIVKSGTYGSEGSSYALERENFSTVVLKENMANGPKWFEVITKDGLILEFGNTGDSRFTDEVNNTVLFWRLNKIRYPDGNYIAYVYTGEDRDSRISEIRYTGNEAAGLDPYNKIEFSYKVRQDESSGFSDIRTVFEAGSSFSNKYLLDQILIKAENQLTKKYQFSYGHDNINSYLKSVTEYGSDQSALNATIFKYGDTPKTFSSETSNIPAGNTLQSFSGDFDGDGKDDILSAHESSTKLGIKFYDRFNVYKLNPAGTGYTQLASQALPTNYTVIRGYEIPNSKSFLPNDFTGDGSDDVLTLNISQNGSEARLENVTIYESKNGGTSYVAHARSVQPNFYRIHPGNKFFYPGDFDGDGIAEYLTILGNTLGNYLPFLCSNYIEGGSCAGVDISGPTRFPVSSWVTADQIHTTDFNGDGKTDLMLIKDNICEVYAFEGATAMLIYSSSFPTKDHVITWGDFNGDGKTDFLARGSNYSLTKGISDGKKYITSPLALAFREAATESGEGDEINAGDFNGDGRTDIMHQWHRIKKFPARYFSAAKPNENVLRTANNLLDFEPLYEYKAIDVYYSRGDGFYHDRIDSQEAEGGESPIFKLTSFSPTDVNGDGRTDLTEIRSLNYVNTFFLKKNGQESLLQKVTNGINHSTEWNYKGLPDGGAFYAKSGNSGYPVNNIQVPLYAVSNFKVPNGIGGVSTLQYSYEDARLHRAGRGFLGFKKTTVSNLTTGIKTVSENEMNSTYYVAVPKKTSTYVSSNNSLIGETTMTSEFVSSGDKRFWIKSGGIREYKAMEGRTVTIANRYDDYGNITESSIESDADKTLTKTSYAPFPGNIPNKPMGLTVIKTRNGQLPHSISTAYDYNDTGQLRSKTDFSGTSNGIATTYSYNNLGNLTATTSSPGGMTPRTSSTRFDSKGRYPESSANALNQSSFTTYDPRWGKAVSVTGIDGLTNTYTYDAFGRITATGYPGNYSVNQSYGWDFTNGAVWYSLLSHPGKPDVKTWYDLLGRQIRTETEAFPSGWITQVQTYDAKGNIVTSSQPYKPGETVYITQTSYDEYNRPNLINQGPQGNTTIGYTYSSGNLTVTTSTPSGTSSKTTDAGGYMISASDHGGTLAYTYYSHGGLKDVKSEGTTLTASEYDEYGRQKSLTDINAGTVRYQYDAIGQLVSQLNENGENHSMTYNLLGQVTSRTGPEGTTSYAFYRSGAAVNQPEKITGFAGDQTEYSYDGLGRLLTLKRNIDGMAHATTYGYNMYGAVTSHVYPSGFGTNHEYDANGYLTAIKNRDNSVTLYSSGGINGQGQVTAYSKGNGKSSTITYENSLPVKYETAGIQNLYLTWNYQTGNLISRNDARSLVNKTEQFSYDNLNRLMSATVVGAGGSVTASYASNGNITTKTDAGIYSYGASKRNAVTDVSNPAPSSIPDFQQRITYTSFMQPNVISENASEGMSNELTYTYGADYERIKGILKRNGNIINTRYYFRDGYEKDVTNGITRYIQYVASPAGLAAIVVSEGETHTPHYTYGDHLGSILTVTSSSGAVEAEQSFNAWGRRRDVVSWEPLAPTAPTGLPDWLYRGYTGHEHLDVFGLINMNGRMYDPVIGRMLSTDNYLQAPGFTQSYNRYSYALNNPLIYTDPDGQFWNIVIGAAVGGVLNLGIQAASGNIHGFGDGAKAFGKGALIGAMSAMGCASCGFAELAFGTALSVGSSYLPSYSLNLGNSGFSLSIGGSVGFGSTGLAFGLSVGLNYSSEAFSAGISYGVGYSLSDQITSRSGWGHSLGGGAIVGGSDFRVGIFTNQFSGRGLDQRTGTFYLESNGWSLAYENDWQFGLKIAGGSDKYRTTGFRVSKGDFSFGLNLFTGDPDATDPEANLPRPHTAVNGHETYFAKDGSSPNDYRLGALYAGYKGYRAGWSSEGIRHIFQNRFAHDFIQHGVAKWFQALPGFNSPYINYQTINRFTTWGF